MSNKIEDAAQAVQDGELVVYPTETVYGFGGDALDPDIVDAVFTAKDRDRDDPISMAVHSVDAAAEYVELTDLERRFMDAVLPGPVTVVVEAGPEVPDVLTAGRDRVGVRVPDHEVARSLLERTGPITATSANLSGEPAPSHPRDLDRMIRIGAWVVLEHGSTPGGASTVVDVEAGEVIREGRLADTVEEWLADV
jgi:L-threonylcarbamoyladenylate synthase